MAPVQSIESSSKEECKPLDNLQALLSWTPDNSDWSNKVITLSPRSDYCYEGSSFECHKKFRKPIKSLTSGVPKTLVCHDMKGGYLDDRFVRGVPYENQYIFYYWSLIDIFVYFSHHFVTIPPLMWINAAHRNGVSILGTIITEHTDGKAIWNQVLSSDDTLYIFTKKLSEICTHFGFDGFLINIENEIDPQLLPRLVMFLKNLKAQLGQSRILLWYDAVSLVDGKLNWQNELNEHNEKAFKVCDGIYLNYGWDESRLENTVHNAGSRQFDVYIGIDVFGRGCFEGGGFNTDLALKLIRSFTLSTALFGTGWTHETQNPRNPSEFFAIERKFWNKLLPYLYIHIPKHLPFETTFNRGIARRPDVDNILWYNLSHQSYQSTALICSHTNSDDCCICLNETFLGDNCILLKKSNCEIDLHRILICDFYTSIKKPLCFSISAKSPKDYVTSLKVIMLIEGECKNFTIILNVEHSRSVVMEHEICDYSCDLSLSNVISMSKSIIVLRDDWLYNKFELNLNGKITEIHIKVEKSTAIKYIKFE